MPTNQSGGFTFINRKAITRPHGPVVIPPSLPVVKIDNIDFLVASDILTDIQNRSIKITRLGKFARSIKIKDILATTLTATTLIIRLDKQNDVNLIFNSLPEAYSGDTRFTDCLKGLNVI